MAYLRASEALEGLVVLDLTQARAGPVCVRQLADWGANVIKIDRPGNPPDFAGRKDGDFQNKHRNKRSMALNLKSEEGRNILYEMVRKTDVLVENFRPDIKARLGFDYERLKKINPALVYTSISGFGQEGPYKQRTAVDQIMQGMSGIMSVNGRPGDGPLRVGIPITDICTGLYAAFGTMVALLEKQKSGRGQWVQTSLFESSIFFLDVQVARYLVEGIVGQQVGNEHPTGAATNAYKTKNGYVNVAPLPAMWGRLCKAIGREDLIDHPDYRTRKARMNRRVEINDIIEEFTKRHESADLLELFMAAEVPCGPIYSIEEAFADPQARSLQLGQTVIATNGQEITLPRQPITLSRTPSSLVRRTPEFAEHTDEVLVEFGYSPNEIADFRKNGSVE